jgi:hypothetical protein
MISTLPIGKYGEEKLQKSVNTTFNETETICKFVHDCKIRLVTGLQPRAAGAMIFFVVEELILESQT